MGGSRGTQLRCAGRLGAKLTNDAVVVNCCTPCAVGEASSCRRGVVAERVARETGSGGICSGGRGRPAGVPRGALIADNLRARRHNLRTRRDDRAPDTVQRTQGGGSSQETVADDALALSRLTCVGVGPVCGCVGITAAAALLHCKHRPDVDRNEPPTGRNFERL